jgi:feruloyl esterase
MSVDQFNPTPWCKVVVRMAHPPARSIATAWIGLPLKGWNGRFLGLGGGGWQGGAPLPLNPAVAKGFAVGLTDAGHPLDGEMNLSYRIVNDGSFVLDPDGRLDWSAVRNFAYQGAGNPALCCPAALRLLLRLLDRRPTGTIGGAALP